MNYKIIFLSKKNMSKTKKFILLIKIKKMINKFYVYLLTILNYFKEYVKKKYK